MQKLEKKVEEEKCDPQRDHSESTLVKQSDVESEQKPEVLSEPELKPITDFAVVSGKIHIVDPCYQLPKYKDEIQDCHYAAWNVKALNGRWRAKMSHCPATYPVTRHPTRDNRTGRFSEVSSPTRVKALIAYHSSVDTRDLRASRFTRWFWRIVIDSGQIGIWDSDRYPADPGDWDNISSFFRRVSDQCSDTPSAIDDMGVFCQERDGMHRVGIMLNDVAEAIAIIVPFESQRFEL
jgi:hypothetical protein